MKIYSFIKSGFELTPIQVEITLVPGIPKIHIMGLADTAIKESEMRIKSALKFSGFEMPKGQQILVNLKPAFTKKSSCGLDLAIACAYLWKSGQVIAPDKINEGLFVYGELGLEGAVSVPDDLGLLYTEKPMQIISGFPERSLGLDIMAMKTLKDLDQLSYLPADHESLSRQPPHWSSQLKFSKNAAKALAISALGEHSVLLAGPAGSGKSTLAEALFYLLSDLDEKTYRQAVFINKALGRDIQWRPFVSPHHTTPVISMVGGGHPILPGEISRAHGGLLFLDEFLEFKNEVKESLREPIETGSISVARRGQFNQFPADFLLVGATNLCPCGDLVPGKPSQCRFSLKKCQSYLEKLSGPLLDRFQMLVFSDNWHQKGEFGMEDIRDQIEEGLDFQKFHRKSDLKNCRLPMTEIKVDAPDDLLEKILPSGRISRRRQMALMRVARSFADLGRSKKIRIEDINQSLAWTQHNFSKIQRICQ